MKYPFKKWSHRLSCFLIILSMLFSLFGCATTSQKEKISVSWFDADGSLIATEVIDADTSPSYRNLPSDTDLWHYTGWSISKSGNVTVCTATRQAKTQVIWKDCDGTVLKKTYFFEKDKEPVFDLPKSNDKWTYTGWASEHKENKIVYTAERVPNLSYFCGNVFQIIIKDKNGEPIKSGSGFVINSEGWFVTNDHVMENGYSATAFFDIPNTATGAKYTSLNISGGVYHDSNKDIFIGKLDNYQKLKQYYHILSFTETYAEGDVCYSVGYPNSSVNLKIHEGSILEDYSDIYDKINGNRYILSDSYIAPGSSGGILVDQKFQIIGITSMGLYADSNKTVYISGGSIPYSAFKANLKNLNAANLKTLNVIYGIH